MSIQDVTGLLEAALRDSSLRARLESAADLPDLVRIAADSGHELSVKDLEGLFAHMQGAASEELGDDELEKVAGGVGVLAGVPGAVTGYKEHKVQAMLGQIKWTRGLADDFMGGLGKMIPKLE